MNSEPNPLERRVQIVRVRTITEQTVVRLMANASKWILILPR